jgi:hypothetical protein
MLLVNDPVPDPSMVFEFEVVGLVAVFQHTPLTVTADPPSLEILPPVLAVVVVTPETVVMVIDGRDELSPLSPFEQLAINNDISTHKTTQFLNVFIVDFGFEK